MKFLNVMFFIFILAMLLTTCTSGCATRPQYYIINNPVPIGLMESTQRDVPMNIITNDIINANHTELNTVVDETVINGRPIMNGYTFWALVVLGVGVILVFFLH